MELIAEMRSRARVSAATLVGTPSRLEMAMILRTESSMRITRLVARRSL